MEIPKKKTYEKKPVKKSHCKTGHALTEDNIAYANGYPTCLICKRAGRNKVRNRNENRFLTEKERIALKSVIGD